MTLTFYSGGLQVSPALLASQTGPIATLASSARAQAQTLANAAGFSVGPILSLDTSDTSLALVINAFAFPLAYVTSGGIPPYCSVAVKFRLLTSQ